MSTVFLSRFARRGNLWSVRALWTLPGALDDAANRRRAEPRPGNIPPVWSIRCYVARRINCIPTGGLWIAATAIDAST